MKSKPAAMMGGFVKNPYHKLVKNKNKPSGTFVSILDHQASSSISVLTIDTIDSKCGGESEACRDDDDPNVASNSNSHASIISNQSRVVTSGDTDNDNESNIETHKHNATDDNQDGSTTTSGSTLSSAHSDSLTSFAGNLSPPKVTCSASNSSLDSLYWGLNNNFKKVTSITSSLKLNKRSRSSSNKSKNIMSNNDNDNDSGTPDSLHHSSPQSSSTGGRSTERIWPSNKSKSNKSSSSSRLLKDDDDDGSGSVAKKSSSKPNTGKDGSVKKDTSRAKKVIEPIAPSSDHVTSESRQQESSATNNSIRSSNNIKSARPLHHLEPIVEVYHDEEEFLKRNNNDPPRRGAANTGCDSFMTFFQKEEEEETILLPPLIVHSHSDDDDNALHQNSSSTSMSLFDDEGNEFIFEGELSPREVKRALNGRGGGWSKSRSRRGGGPLSCNTSTSSGSSRGVVLEESEMKKAHRLQQSRCVVNHLNAFLYESSKSRTTTTNSSSSSNGNGNGNRKRY